MAEGSSPVQVEVSRAPSGKLVAKFSCCLVYRHMHMHGSCKLKSTRGMNRLFKKLLSIWKWKAYTRKDHLPPLRKHGEDISYLNVSTQRMSWTCYVLVDAVAVAISASTRDLRGYQEAQTDSDPATRTREVRSCLIASARYSAFVLAAVCTLYSPYTYWEIQIYIHIHNQPNPQSHDFIWFLLYVHRNKAKVVFLAQRSTEMFYEPRLVDPKDGLNHHQCWFSFDPRPEAKQ